MLKSVRSWQFNKGFAVNKISRSCSACFNLSNGLHFAADSFLNFADGLELVPRPHRPVVFVATLPAYGFNPVHVILSLGLASCACGSRASIYCDSSCPISGSDSAALFRSWCRVFSFQKIHDGEKCRPRPEHSNRSQNKGVKTCQIEHARSGFQHFSESDNRDDNGCHNRQPPNRKMNCYRSLH